MQGNLDFRFTARSQSAIDSIVGRAPSASTQVVTARRRNPSSLMIFVVFSAGAIAGQAEGLGSITAGREERSAGG